MIRVESPRDRVSGRRKRAQIADPEDSGKGRVLDRLKKTKEAKGEKPLPTSALVATVERKATAEQSSLMLNSSSMRGRIVSVSRRAPSRAAEGRVVS